MLEQISIFSQTGLVLWSRNLCKIKGDPINELIKTVLIEEKGGDKTANFDRYTLKWTLANELNIVFVVVYQRILQIFYVEELLKKIKQEFLKHFEEAIKEGVLHGYDFDKHFDRVLREVEKSALIQKRNASKKPDRNGKRTNNATKKSNDKPKMTPTDGECEQEIDEDSTDSGEDVNDLDEEEAFRQQALKRLQARKMRSQKSKQAPLKEDHEESEAGKRGPKKPTVWHDGSGKKLTAKAKAALDRSKDKSNEGEIREDQLEEMKQTYLPEHGENAEWEEDEAEEGQEGDEWWSFGKSKIGGFFQSLTGKKILTNEDIDPIIMSMRENLMSKNVAAEIAEEICSSLRNNLEGQRLASFTRIKTMVQNALKRAVVQVLTPKKPTDILREILASRQRGKPYSLVFIGVNGVGKSTSLAKVCYYLKEHGISVIIAACDTFRSGAVEQLNVHAQCLDVPLFEKGYARDPAGVAGAAIQYAQENGIDCVLIDTAGRMQNNVPLMRALSKLITDNEPDLVLFVGEALVGNDGIDQLTMFNQAILNYSPPGKRHQIDGIVLTKFDTIDTKVGAALSMTYKTGQPVVFVGTGQKYTHLRKMNVNMVIKALFN